MITHSANKKPIHIVFAADEKYMPHAAAMIHSLYTHNAENNIHVHFVCPPELKSSLKSELETFCSRLGIAIEFIVVPDHLIEHLPTQGYLSKVVWYRVLMPQLFKDLDKILFLDCDVIVNDDIQVLWDTDLGENLFAAVTNVVEERHAGRAAELGLSGPGDYFNAGVALWNLSLMRQINFTENVISFAKKNHSRLLWLEQDAINSLYSKKRVPLHPRWNYQNGMCFDAWGNQYLDARELAEAKANPGIIHFEGGDAGKPWHILCKHPLRKLYFTHRKQTPWKRVRLDGINLKNLIKRYFLHPLRGWRNSYTSS